MLVLWYFTNYLSALPTISRILYYTLYPILHIMHLISISQGYIAMSPSKEQVAQQAAMEVIPLVMEPESDFYTGNMYRYLFTMDHCVDIPLL